MRGPRTLQLEDRETGLKLYSEKIRDPGGNIVFLYVFETTPPRGLPEHLGPRDPFNGVDAQRAFQALVEWLKANPERPKIR